MNNSSGKIGERYVLQMLLEQGYTFIDANYHSRFGEIDIIVADDKYIVFVEVKTRDEKSISTPLEAVTFSKKKKLIQKECFWTKIISPHLLLYAWQKMESVLSLLRENREQIPKLRKKR